jgi:hypothetical protein
MFIRRASLVLFFSVTVIGIVVGQSNGKQREIFAISNNQLVGHHQGILWKVTLVSEAADKVVRQAKQLPFSAERDFISRELVSLLADTTKGIAAHFVLCAIWKKQVSSGSKSVGHNPGLLECTYGDLTFFQSEGKTYATTEDLIINQNKWRDFLRH